MANEAEQAIYTRLASAPTFHPATADIFATDWGLDAGDVVAVRSGNDTYNVPVYNMSLNWKGNSRVQIQSTGNETRKPLSALKRKQYGGGSARHKEIEELGVQYSQQFLVSDKRVASIMSATGVLLDENNEPVTAYNPDTGEYEYVFDTTGAGATLASHVSQTAGKLETEVTARTAQGETLNSRITQTATEINSTVSALDGRVSEIKQTVDGITLTGNTISIKGNSINLDGFVSATDFNAEKARIDALYGGSAQVEGLYSKNGITALKFITAGTYVNAPDVQISGTSLKSAIVDFGAATYNGNNVTIPTTKADGTAGPSINFNKPGQGTITAITKSGQTWKPNKFDHGGFDVDVIASGNNVGTYSDTIEVDAAYAYSAGWQEGYDEGEADGRKSTATFQTKTFTTNGTKTPDSGYDGFSSVTINVPQTVTANGTITDIAKYGDPTYQSSGSNHYYTVATRAYGTNLTNTGNYFEKNITVNASDAYQDGYTEGRKSTAVLQTKSITTNGTKTPDSGYDGFSSVTVNVPQTTAKLQTKTFTTNGTKTPESGFDGFSSVTVNVPTAGDSISISHDSGTKTTLGGQYSIKEGYRYTFTFTCGEVSTRRTFKGVAA